MTMAAENDSLELLSARALHWLADNLDFLDPSLSSPLPATPRLKAMLQLGQLCHYWARMKPEDENIRPVAALARKIWQWPGVTEQLALAPLRYARPLALIYGALPPAGTASERHKAVLAGLAADGYLTPAGKSPYLRLETRHFADLAGASHGIESYAELYQSSPLAGRTAALPMSYSDACKIAHIIFYLCDFGFREPDLSREDKVTAYRISCELTDHYVEQNEWDYVAKYLLAQFCFGGDPARSPHGAAGIQCLVRAQGAGGEIPASSAAQQVRGSAAPIEFFRKAYQVTLVTALTSLIISSAPVREMAA
jgi:hypothetical protein